MSSVGALARTTLNLKQLFPLERKRAALLFLVKLRKKSAELRSPRINFYLSIFFFFLSWREQIPDTTVFFARLSFPLVLTTV